MALRRCAQAVAKPLFLRRCAQPEGFFAPRAFSKWVTSEVAERPQPPADAPIVNVEFVSSHGGVRKVSGQAGLRVLDIAQDNGVPMQGSCEGNMSCSTCHVILSQEDFDRLPPPEEEELDMVELALEATPTSRLGCQIFMTKELSGLRCQLPSEVVDYLDGNLS